MIKHVIFILILSISFSIPPISANAATLYVDVNGADTNTGSYNNPFRTIQKAADVVKPGDAVKVRPGVYYERVSIRTSGLPGQPITFEGESGTIVDGSDAPNRWELGYSARDWNRSLQADIVCLCTRQYVRY